MKSSQRQSRDVSFPRIRGFPRIWELPGQVLRFFQNRQDISGGGCQLGHEFVNHSLYQYGLYVKCFFLLTEKIKLFYLLPTLPDISWKWVSLSVSVKTKLRNLAPDSLSLHNFWDKFSKKCQILNRPVFFQCHMVKFPLFQ